MLHRLGLYFPGAAYRIEALSNWNLPRVVLVDGWHKVSYKTFYYSSVTNVWALVSNDRIIAVLRQIG